MSRTYEENQKEKKNVSLNKKDSTIDPKKIYMMFP